MTEQQSRESLVEYGRSLFLRGYSCGTSGNLSVRLADGSGFLMSPTNVSLGRLASETLSRLDADGRHVAGAAPTKEAWLHLAMYAVRPDDHAVVHLHSTHAAALSCRTDLPPEDAVPPLTPYVIMRVGRVALLPYSRPGDTSAAGAIRELAARHRAVLLANHGPVVAGRDLETAVSAAEELEETARLFFLLEGRPHRPLTREQVADVERVFGPTGAAGSPGAGR
jgi:ribulose-5-phosphate 4-epimerase/fuculose-1-phosphate aldolase